MLSFLPAQVKYFEKWKYLENILIQECCAEFSDEGRIRQHMKEEHQLEFKAEHLHIFW